MLPRTQGNNTGTLLALIPRSNQKEIAQLIEITTISHFPRLGLTLKHQSPVNVNALRHSYMGHWATNSSLPRAFDARKAAEVAGQLPGDPGQSQGGGEVNLAWWC